MACMPCSASLLHNHPYLVTQQPGEEGLSATLCIQRGVELGFMALYLHSSQDTHLLQPCSDIWVPPTHSKTAPGGQDKLGTPVLSFTGHHFSQAEACSESWDTLAAPMCPQDGRLTWDSAEGMTLKRKMAHSGHPVHWGPPT